MAAGAAFTTAINTIHFAANQNRNTLAGASFRPPHPRRNPNVRVASSHQLFATRRFFSTGVGVRVAGTDAEIVNGDESESKEDKIDIQDLPPMKTLIESYKKALLDGDEKVLSQLEAAIGAVENSKNNMSAKCTEITADINSRKEKFLRLNADFLNFRKQIEKDRARFTSNIQVEVIESLLPVVDSFEKTRQQITPETEKEQKIGASYQGIYKQFVETLRSLGVGVVETVGKPFDPTIHEAVAREANQQYKAGIVSHEVHRGFLLRDRLVRSAIVKVSTGSAQPNPKPASEKSVEEPESAEKSMLAAESSNSQ